MLHLIPKGVFSRSIYLLLLIHIDKKKIQNLTKRLIKEVQGFPERKKSHSFEK